MNSGPSQLPTGIDRMIVAAKLPGVAPEEAFLWFIIPERLMRWWTQEAETDRRPGGHYVLRWPAMDWELSGEYLVYEPGTQLSFTWQWAHRPDLPPRTVDVAFRPATPGTKVIVTHGFYGESALEQDDRQSHIDGWLHFLGRLQEQTA